MADERLAGSGRFTVELTGPASVLQSNWVVVKEPGRRSRTTLGEVTPDRGFVERDSAPFNSVILREEVLRRTAARRRMFVTISRALGWTLAALLGTALLTGIVQLRAVASDSMAGTFQRGDVLLVVSPEIIHPRVGEIAVFNYYNLDRTELIGLFSHRIVGGDASHGWVTQGDANPDPDTSPVLPQDVSGVVAAWVPYVGFALQPYFLLALLSITVMVYLFAGDIKAWARSIRT